MKHGIGYGPVMHDSLDSGPIKGVDTAAGKSSFALNRSGKDDLQAAETIGIKKSATTGHVFDVWNSYIGQPHA